MWAFPNITSQQTLASMGEVRNLAPNQQRPCVQIVCFGFGKFIPVVEQLC